MIRAGQIQTWCVQPDRDPTWTETDWARACTLEARWKAKEVSEEERIRLLPCAVWKRKFPGLLYSAPIESRLQQLMPQN